MSSYGPTQFRYAVTPEQVAAGGGDVTLEITVRNETGADVACKMIRFPFPAAQLGTAIQASSDSQTWQIVPSTDAPNAFDATPVSPATGLGAGQAVGFQFAGVAPSATPGPATIAVLEATGDGIGEQDLTVEIADTQLAISAFTVSSVFVAPETTVTFAWATVGADSVTLDWGEGSHDGGPSGSLPVQPAAGITATLTAIKAGSDSVSAQLVIVVETPQILSFATDPSPAQIAQGGTVVLSWQTLYAQACTLSFTPLGALASGSDDVPTTGTSTQTPVTGVYELQAVGNGRTVPATQYVTVEPVQLTAPFTATGSPLALGESATLSWATEWAASVTITPDPGVGTLPLSGSVQVSPTVDTVYTLTADGLDPVTATAQVAVAPWVTALGVAFDGPDAALVVWASQNAASAAFAGTASGAVDPNGTLAIGPAPEMWSSTLTLTSPLGATVDCRVIVGLDNPIPEGYVGDVAFQSTGALPLNAPGAAGSVSWSALTMAGEVGQDVREPVNGPSPVAFTVPSTPGVQPLWMGLMEDDAGCLSFFVAMTP